MIFTPWALATADESDTAFEIDGQSDRAAGIIAASFLETRLTQTIRSRLHPHEEANRRLFDPKRGSADFSTKIDLGMLLCLYSNSAWKDMHIIREVRNDFAHRIERLDFSSAIIAEQVAKMAFLRGYLATLKGNWPFGKPVAPAAPRPLFVETIKALIALLYNASTTLPTLPPSTF